MAKIGRNQSCPCGSGKKYKHCHGNPLLERGVAEPLPLLPQVRAMVQETEAKEQTRIEQQGLGRPIISTDYAGHKVVAVGNTIHFSNKWAYFPDFLMYFIKQKLNGEWGNAEIEKPFHERHPLMQWYHLLCEFQARQEKDENGHYNAPTNGLVKCYLGLAHNLYLLEHNAELQERYINRLKRADQFQGAYYELLVANCLIRAGFELELENEADDTKKHCEFSARSKLTGKKYWVEAKMRAVAGVLGRTNKDGQTRTTKPTSRLAEHLGDALKKPAEDERIVFIDVNAEPMASEDFASVEPKVPKWMAAAEKQLQNRERNLKEGERAYVFVTNFCYHNALDSTHNVAAAVTFGLGIEDYGKPRRYTLKGAWQVKQKHADLFALEKALKSYPQIPNSFDGDLPPVRKGEHGRIKIGRLYNFEDAGVTGVVTTATVSEPERKIYIGVAGTNGTSHILSEDISDRELEVYRAHPNTYFGVVHPAGKQINDPFEFFEWILDSYKNTPKEKLIEFMKDAPDIEELRQLSQEELALEYCERITISAMNQQQKK